MCTPAPNFPVGLWKDENNSRLNETYLSKYPGKIPIFYFILF